MGDFRQRLSALANRIAPINETFIPEMDAGLNKAEALWLLTELEKQDREIERLRKAAAETYWGYVETDWQWRARLEGWITVCGVRTDTNTVRVAVREEPK